MSGRSSRRLDAAFGGWRPQGKPVPSCEMSVAIARHFYRRPGAGRSLSSNVEQRESLSHAGCDDGCAQGLMRRNRARVGVRLIACRQSGWGCRQAFATTRRVLLNDRGRGMLRRAGSVAASIARACSSMVSVRTPRCSHRHSTPPINEATVHASKGCAPVASGSAALLPTMRAMVSMALRARSMWWSGARGIRPSSGSVGMDQGFE